MTRQSPILKLFAGGAVVFAALAAAPRANAQYTVFDADVALSGCHERVESYAALHRRLAPPVMTSTDPLSKLLTGNYLAAAVRGARPYAQQGEIFTPEVATLFRWMLAESVGERDGEGFLPVLNGNHPAPPGMHPTVNETYPMMPLYRVPQGVRLGLPPIPTELDYRI